MVTVTFIQFVHGCLSQCLHQLHIKFFIDFGSTIIVDNLFIVEHQIGWNTTFDMAGSNTAITKCRIFKIQVDKNGLHVEFSGIV